jgi:hypothetical protein
MVAICIKYCYVLLINLYYIPDPPFLLHAIIETALTHLRICCVWNNVINGTNVNSRPGIRNNCILIKAALHEYRSRFSCTIWIWSCWYVCCMAYVYNMNMNVMLIFLLYGLHVQYEDECYVDMSVVWLRCTIWRWMLSCWYFCCMAYMYNMKMNAKLICLLYGLHVQYEDECYVDMSVVWLTCTIWRWMLSCWYVCCMAYVFSKYKVFILYCAYFLYSLYKIIY